MKFFCKYDIPVHFPTFGRQRFEKLKCWDKVILFFYLGGQRCDCDLKGSYNRSCHLYTGQCHCREGVTGRKCEKCLPNHYGFSATGCRVCNCDPVGSLSLQCDLNTGQCPCQTGVVGKQCNRCQENRYNISAGCLECAPCYNLVKDASDGYRVKLRKLEQALDAVAGASVTVKIFFALNLNSVYFLM
jgi:laminin, gamma 1